MNREIIAIPVFGSQVSPRYDCAPEVLFVEIENGEVVSRRKAAMDGMTSLQRIRELSAAGATLLVCGALPGFYRRMLDFLGIRIVHTDRMATDVLIERIKHGEYISSFPCGYGGRGKRRRVVLSNTETGKKKFERSKYGSEGV